MHSRARVGFGVGNLVTAVLLAVGVYMMPLRHVAIDALLVLAAIVTAVSGATLLANVSWAPKLQRIAALTLLAFGLVAVALAVLTLVFLAGVHGRWLEAGIPITYAAVALIVPYAVVYPIVQLLFAPNDERGTAA